MRIHDVKTRRNCVNCARGCAIQILFSLDKKTEITKLLFSLIPYSEKKWGGLWNHLAVFVCVCLPLPTSECLNQYLLNLACISWHLSPSERRTSEIPPIGHCDYMCVPHIIARQRLGKHVLSARNTHDNKKIFVHVSYEVRVVWKESRRLVVPKCSCLNLLFIVAVRIKIMYCKWEHD